MSVEQEWSHFILSDEVGGKIIKLDVSPPAESLPALCKRLGVVSIEKCSATLRLQRNSVTKIIHVAGQVNADLHQKCVVSADPVQEHVEDEFDAWFAEPNSTVSFSKARRERMSRKEKNEQPIIEEEEDPEEIVDGKIDVGELCVQYISLALNPYPRAEDVVYDVQDDVVIKSEDDMYDNPFAALKDWKTSETKKDK